jgi:heme-degrading monooxygenase HmoA
MIDAAFAATPEPPYYAVIFTSRRTEELEGYDATAARMLELAATQPGFLGAESARGTDGLGITVSYWRSLEAIQNWRNHDEHRLAQTAGRQTWYSHYEARVARVERAYRGP